MGGNLKQAVLFLAVMAISLMAGIDLMIIAVVLKPMAQNLQVPFSHMGLLMTSFAVGDAIFLGVTGPLADHFQIRNLLRVGLFLFGLSSLAIACSTSFMLTTALRFVQGAACAASVVASLVYVNRFAPKDQEMLWTSSLVAATGLGMALGPIFGGYLSVWWGWHGAFLFNIPVAIAAFIAVSVCMPPTPSLNRSKARQSWVPQGVLRNKQFWCVSLFAAVPYFGVTAFLYAWGVYWAHGFHLTPVMIGQRLAGFGVMVFLSGFAVQRIGRRCSLRTLVLMGVFFSSLAFTYLYLLTLHATLWRVELGFGLFGVGFLLSNGASIRWATECIPKAHVGLASGLTLTIRWLGAALGGVLAPWVYMHRAQAALGGQPERRLMLDVLQGVAKVKWSNSEPLVHLARASAQGLSDVMLVIAIMMWLVWLGTLCLDLKIRQAPQL